MNTWAVIGKFESDKYPTSNDQSYGSEYLDTTHESIVAVWLIDRTVWWKTANPKLRYFSRSG